MPDLSDFGWLAQLENQAGCGAMRVQGAIGSEQPRLGGRQLAAAVDHPAFGAYTLPPAPLHVPAR